MAVIGVHDGDQEGAHSDQHDIAHTFHPDDPVLHQDEGIELTGQSACHQSRDKVPSRQSGGEGKTVNTMCRNIIPAIQ